MRWSAYLYDDVDRHDGQVGRSASDSLAVPTKNCARLEYKDCKQTKAAQAHGHDVVLKVGH